MVSSWAQKQIHRLLPNMYNYIFTFYIYILTFSFWEMQTNSSTARLYLECIQIKNYVYFCQLVMNICCIELVNSMPVCLIKTFFNHRCVLANLTNMPFITPNEHGWLILYNCLDKPRFILGKRWRNHGEFEIYSTIKGTFAWPSDCIYSISIFMAGKLHCSETVD